MVSKRKRRLRPRHALPGYPVPTHHLSDSEIAGYFAGHEIVCLLCGRAFRHLSMSHLRTAHATDPDGYRERYGLPYDRGLFPDGLLESWRARGKNKEFMAAMQPRARRAKAKGCSLPRSSAVKRRRSRELAQKIPSQGELNGRARLSRKDVDSIRSSDVPTVTLAARMGVSWSTVADVRHGRTWRLAVTRWHPPLVEPCDEVGCVE